MVVTVDGGPGGALYDQLDVGIGHFPGRVCAHDECDGAPAPAAVYFEVPQLGGGVYLCARHFGHMVATIAEEYRACR